MDGILGYQNTCETSSEPWQGRDVCLDLGLLCRLPGSPKACSGQQAMGRSNSRSWTGPGH